MAKELGVDEVKFKTAQVYEYKNGNPLIPTIEKYSRYALEKDGTYSLKKSLGNECWKMWHSCVVSWDGKIIPAASIKMPHIVWETLRKKLLKTFGREVLTRNSGNKSYYQDHKLIFARIAQRAQKYGPKQAILS